jgi:hypothetical protein
MAKGNWRRRDFGWLRADGEAFLERGAPMSDTGKPAWLVWIRALDSEIEIGEGGTVLTRDGCDPVRALGELCGNEPSQVRPDGPWFIHRGDEGWLADAKAAAEYHLARRDEKADAVTR